MRTAAFAVVAVTMGLITGVVAAQTTQPASDADARALAARVIKASGGDNWANTQRVRFTFDVERDGKVIMSATHDWDLARGVDTVTWRDSSGEKTVAVDLKKDPATYTEDEKAAFARWTNDTYWLLAPLKINDPGTELASGGTVERDGKTVHVLKLSFARVGLTPGDQYHWYIDPQTDLPVAWDYIPNAQTTRTFTWEAYAQSGGLTLSTLHRGPGLTIRINDLQVE